MSQHSFFRLLGPPFFYSLLRPIGLIYARRIAMSNHTLLERTVALVTGASSGIGEATAERLAKAGYKVYGTSRRGAQASTRSFEMIALDVTNDESVAAAVRQVMQLEGRIN